MVLVGGIKTPFVRGLLSRTRYGQDHVAKMFRRVLIARVGGLPCRVEFLPQGIGRRRETRTEERDSSFAITGRTCDNRFNLSKNVAGNNQGSHSFLSNRSRSDTCWLREGPLPACRAWGPTASRSSRNRDFRPYTNGVFLHEDS